MANEFVGPGLPMTADGLGAGCDRLGVKAADVWAVLTVGNIWLRISAGPEAAEFCLKGTFSGARTNGAFDSQGPDLSNAVPGGYGARGALQYERLGRAIQLNRAAALRSTSWGIGQVMGFNAVNAGISGRRDDGFGDGEERRSTNGRRVRVFC